MVEWEHLLMSRKTKFVLTSFFLLTSLTTLILFRWPKSRRLDLRQRAQEISNEPIKNPQKPSFVSDAILVKLRSGSPEIKTQEDVSKLSEEGAPQALRKINALNKIKSVGKVFANTGPPNIYRVTIENKEKIPQILDALSHDDTVEYAEPDYIYFGTAAPNDPYFLDPQPPAPERNLPLNSGGWNPTKPDNSLLDYQWDLKKINLEAAWDLAGESEVIVAVIDTGVDYTHSELVDQIWQNPRETPDNNLDDDQNGYIDDIKGWDATSYWWKDYDIYRFKRPDNDPMDDRAEPYFHLINCPGAAVGGGHGTHVAGIISAKKNNQLGMAGINSRAKIMMLRGLTADGWGYVSQLAELISYAVNNGAKIINMSWGGDRPSQVLADALERAHSVGVVLVAAAGNDGREQLSYPAAYPSVISVAATNEQDSVTSYSNFGSWIDIAAPGSDGSGGRNPRSLLSLRGKDTDMYCLSQTSCCALGQLTEKIVGEDKTYYRAAGTSMAAPHVAGLASLILSKNPNLTNEEVRSVVEYSAVDLGEFGKDNKYGFGRIDAERALREFSTNPPPVAFISDPYDEEHLYFGTSPVKGTAASRNYLRHALEFAPLENPNNWSSEGISLSSLGSGGVTNGTLGQWDSGSLEGKFLLRLTVVDQESRSRTFQRKVEIINRSLVPGWPKSLPYDSFGASLLADLNVDSKQEIVILSGGNVLAYQKANATLLKSWDLDSGYSTGRRSLAAGDTDSTRNGQEIVVGSNNVEILYQDGAKTNLNLGGYFQGSLADLDKDNEQEILTLERSGSGDAAIWKLHAFKAPKANTPEEASGFPVQINTGNQDISVYPYHLRVGDINGDSQEDVAIYLYQNQGRLPIPNKIIAVSGAGQVLWEKTTHEGFGFEAAPFLLADLNSDGAQEVIFYDFYSLDQAPWQAAQLHIWKGDGSYLFPNSPFDLSRIGPSSVHLANLDSDNPPEIIVSGYEKFLIIENDGQQREYPQPSFKVRAQGLKTVVGDLNNNGSREFLAVGEVYMLPSGSWPQITNLMVGLLEYSSAGFTEKPGWPKSLVADVWALGANGWVEGLFMSDIDKNSKADLAISYCLRRKNSCYFYVLEEPTPLGQSDWPQYLHDERHTGAYTSPPRPTYAPVITTTKFKTGYVGQSYQDKVTIIDADANDTLTVTITNLPRGLRQGSCRKVPIEEKTSVRCFVEGTPLVGGRIALVKVRASDAQGHTTQKQIPLKIVANLTP